MALKKKKEYDVLVIGGGVTGCGIILDSTLRGKNGVEIRTRLFFSILLSNYRI